VIVNDFHIVGIARVPPEAQPPLIVDAYAVLPGPIAPQGLETVPGRRAQLLERSCRGQQFQLPARDTLDRPEPTGR
jgi:hypothetical protein